MLYRFLAFIAVWASFGCLPKGQIGSQPEAIKTVKSGPESFAKKNLSQKGLPEFCEALGVKADFACIQCDYKGVLSRRCFGTLEKLDPHKRCKYSSEFVKCLINLGPKLIVIQYEKPMEEVFLSGFESINETLKAVATRNQKLSKPGREGVLRLLSFLHAEKRKLLDGDGVFELYREKVIASCDGCDKEAAFLVFQEEVKKLREYRLSGTINMTHGLDLLQNLMKSVVLDQSVHNFIMDVNLDGFLDF